MRRTSAGIVVAGVLALCMSNVVADAASADTPPADPPGRTVQTDLTAPTERAMPVEAAVTRCDPDRTPARLRGTVPTPRQVLGFRLGSRAATNEEIGSYWDAVDRASNRVVTGVYATSWEGRALRYALVARPSTLRRLPSIQRDLDRLRDPATSQRRARAIVRRTPPILWIAANVHGNEPSGADAVVALLQELADGSDCVARAIRKHAIVGLIPVQNPDGRAHDRRYNAYAFDMNRDVLVATQPEVAGRLQLLRTYPPQLFVDEHENSGKNYFFPPVADPVYHETPDGLYDEVLRLYGPANERAFQARGWRYETWRSGYDFFAQVYGDTVPTTQLGAVGMTFEQGDDVAYPKRVRHHYTSALTTLFTAATHHRRVLRTWRSTFVQATAEGEQCRLQPNRIYNPGHTLERQVPDRPVCGYFLRGDSRATRRLISRLQTAGVVVDRLARPTVVPDYRPYGDAPRRVTLARGTYWVSLAQPQKHWVQAVLNEDTYVPFPYFYDVSGWSLPLLAGIKGGSTGRPVTAPLQRVPTLRAPRTPEPAGRLPRIAVLDQFNLTRQDYQNTGWLKWRLAQDWRFPYEALLPEEVSNKTLRRFDVLLVGNVDSKPVYRRLDSKGRSAVATWVSRGGRYVGWQEGALLASALGISEVGLRPPEAQSPGALMRIRTPGARTQIAWDSDYNLVLDPGAAARTVGVFPRRMFVSGFATKAETLAGTAVQTVERLGAGSVTLFGYEPNFRAVADDSARLLRTAILRTPAGALQPTVGATPSVAPERATRADVLDQAHSRAWRLAHELRPAHAR